MFVSLLPRALLGGAGVRGRLAGHMGLWKHLHRGWDSFLRFTRCDGGDGSICFWHGFWNGETTVKEKDSNLF